MKAEQQFDQMLREASRRQAEELWMAEQITERLRSYREADHVQLLSR